MDKIEEFIKSEMAKEIKSLPYEATVILYLLDDGKIVAKKNFDRIGNKHCVSFPSSSEIKENADKFKCKKVIFVHSHPPLFFRLFADATPSEMDIIVTDLTKARLKDYGIEVIDHLILSKNKVFSFKENFLF